MRIYLKLFHFARPVSKYLVPFFILTLLATIFGIINFTLLIPVLDIIFGNIDEEKLSVLNSAPDFSMSLSYFRELFNYYFSKVALLDNKMNALFFIAILILSSVFISNLFRYLGIRVMISFKLNTVLKIRDAMYRKITSLDLSFFTRTKRGDIISRILSDTIILENSITSSLSVFIKEPIKLIGYIVVLFTISTKLSLITLMVIPLSGLIISSIAGKLRSDAKLSQKSLARMISVVDETIHGIKIIFGFNAVNYMREKFLKENMIYNSKLRSLTSRTEVASPLSEFLGVLVISVVLLYGGYLILNTESQLKASEFITYILLLSQTLSPSKSLITSYTTLQKGIPSGERVIEVLNEKEKITDCKDSVQIDSFNDKIEFKNVWFAYDDKPVLRDISFNIKKGQSVALVGPSGAGKSTLVDLLCRFYDVQKGNISIDGVDLKNMNIDSLRKMIGIITQDSILFNDSIFNNIAFGISDASLEKVKQASEIANSDEFIKNMEKNYYSNIGEKGGKLSGGQRQRITIARAVLKNPPILVLDEATSSLDTESEQLVRNAIHKLMKSRTSIIIAHRLSTITHADKILVIDDGKIVAEGTHRELLKKSILYKNLSEKQFIEI